jgi:hypothetical protein
MAVLLGVTGERTTGALTVKSVWLLLDPTASSLGVSPVSLARWPPSVSLLAVTILSTGSFITRLTATDWVCSLW